MEKNWHGALQGSMRALWCPTFLRWRLLWSQSIELTVNLYILSRVGLPLPDLLYTSNGVRQFFRRNAQPPSRGLSLRAVEKRLSFFRSGKGDVPLYNLFWVGSHLASDKSPLSKNLPRRVEQLKGVFSACCQQVFKSVPLQDVPQWESPSIRNLPPTSQLCFDVHCAFLGRKPCIPYGPGMDSPAFAIRQTHTDFNAHLKPEPCAKTAETQKYGTEQKGPNISKYVITGQSPIYSTRKKSSITSLKTFTGPVVHIWTLGFQVWTTLKDVSIPHDYGRVYGPRWHRETKNRSKLHQRSLNFWPVLIWLIWSVIFCKKSDCW